jgi:hypothetical protein
MLVAVAGVATHGKAAVLQALVVLAAAGLVDTELGLLQK